MTLLHILQPAMVVLPEVERPVKAVAFKDRVMWTVVALIIFLVCCQIPLYGIQSSSKHDPFYWVRAILASNRGSLMELGISPLVTSSLIMQLLAGSGILKVDQTLLEDRQLFNGAQKLFGLLITVGQAIVYVLSGMFGEVADMGPGNAILLVVQLTMAGVVVLMLDEMLSRGYGMGSGISLFLAANICEGIVWKAFSPTTISTGSVVGQATGKTEFEGAIIALFHKLLTADPSNYQRALVDAFYGTHRNNLPNVGNLIATVAVFLLVVSVQGFEVKIKVQQQNQSKASYSKSIKLFYTSNIPVILLTALISNMYFISQLLYKQYGGNLLVKMLGTWPSEDAPNAGMPDGGLAYYLSPPRNLAHVRADVLHAVFYVAFVLTACALFAKTWIEFSGQSVDDVAAQWKQEGVIIPGHRAGSNNIRPKLQKYIPTAAAFGGMCVGALSIAADFIGAIGSGTGILMAVTIVYGYIESYMAENKKMYGKRM